MSLLRRLPVLLRLLLGLGLRLLSQLRTLNVELPVLLLLLLLVDSRLLGVLDGLLLLPWTLNLTELGVSLPEGLPLAPPRANPEPLGPGNLPPLAPPPTPPLPPLELALPLKPPLTPDPLATCSSSLAPLFPLPAPRPLDSPNPLPLPPTQT